MVPRVVSQHTSNQSQVSVASLLKLSLYQHLLQIVCHPCSTYGPKEMETTVNNTRNAAGQQPTSCSAATNHNSVGRIKPNDFHLLNPLQNTWLASDLHQTLKRSKISYPGYRHLALISSTTIAEQVFVQCCDKCLNISEDYVQI